MWPRISHGQIKGDGMLLKPLTPRLGFRVFRASHAQIARTAMMLMPKNIIPIIAQRNHILSALIRSALVKSLTRALQPHRQM